MPIELRPLLLRLALHQLEHVPLQRRVAHLGQPARQGFRRLRRSGRASRRCGNADRAIPGADRAWRPSRSSRGDHPRNRASLQFAPCGPPAANQFIHDLRAKQIFPFPSLGSGSARKRRRIETRTLGSHAAGTGIPTLWGRCRVHLDSSPEFQNRQPALGEAVTG